MAHPHKSPFSPGLPVTILLAAAIAAAAPPIRIPVDIHLATGLSMTKDGLAMNSWVDQNQIRDAIFPEVNRIWRQAEIEFVLGNVFQTRLLNPPGADRLISEIASSHRNANGEADPERIRKLGELIALVPSDGRTINVYLVPYLGETSQGHAKPGQLRVFVAQWSDKASRAQSPPERFALTERLPFRKGSIARTLAHELGHILGLPHPARSAESTGLLMGGRRAGYDLTPSEIETARAKAAELLQGRVRQRRER